MSLDGVSITYTVGDIDLYGLTDKSHEMSIDRFRGSYNDSLLSILMPDGALPAAINAFLAIDSAHTVLFDAGLGAAGNGTLTEKLSKVSVAPEDIDAVCLTHLHSDHIGGLLYDGQPVFPNATLYLSQQEYDAWSDRGVCAARNTLWKEVLKAYADHIVTFEDSALLCDGLVTVHLTPGHTPGHTVYEVGNGICYIVGDLLHAQDLQLDYPNFSADYDMYPAQATAARQSTLNLIRERGSLMAGAHCYDHFISLGDRDGTHL